MAHRNESYPEIFDVIICGCGPTGAMLSVLLSLYGVRHMVIEREAEINADPRGIALDEDGIRCLQACGIYDKIFTDIGQCMHRTSPPEDGGGAALFSNASSGMTRFQFVGGVHQDLSRKPFLSINYETVSNGKHFSSAHLLS